MGARLRPLHEPLVRAGERIADVSLAEARQRWMQSRAELPAQALRLSDGDPALPASFEGF